MSNQPIPSSNQEELVLPKDIKSYQEILRQFDCAVCESMAIGQEHAGRLAAPSISYATRIFSRMCSHAVSAIRAVPLSRWAKSDFQNWDFGCISGHARAIMDGFLLFSYLVKEATTEEETQTRLNVMNLNDCIRRKEFFRDLDQISFQDQLSSFELTISDLSEMLKANSFFQSLPQSVQKQCLNGKFLTIENKEQLIEDCGFSLDHFNALYDLCSQSIHCLPLSFFRIEPNGRGTGVFNEVDLGYIGLALQICTQLIEISTENLIYIFPDIGHVRKGIHSKFEPGPRENRRPRRRH